jgi:hypothetical protein
MSKEIELGRSYEDLITGFSGMAIGVVHYMTGCSQALLQPRIGEDGKIPESVWFDVQRLSAKTGFAVKLDNGATPGFDKQAPKI